MKAAYQQVEEQPGGAAAVANAMRGNWSVQPGIAATRNQDLVHRVVGRPGVVLLSEGPPSRVAQLLDRRSQADNSLRAGRSDAHHPGGLDAEGQVPIDQLQKTLNKLPNALTPAEVTAVRRRLDALKSQPVADIPKGPMPKSPKAARKGQRPR